LRKDQSSETAKASAPSAISSAIAARARSSSSGTTTSPLLSTRSTTSRIRLRGTSGAGLVCRVMFLT